MSDQSAGDRTLHWEDYLPWLVIFRALRPALSFRALVLAALGLVGMIAGWRVFWVLLVRPPQDAAAGAPLPDPVVSSLGQPAAEAWPPWPWEDAFATFGSEGINVAEGSSWFTPFFEKASQLTLPFQFLFHRELTYTGLAYVLLCGIWALGVWAFFGTVISRMAALKLTRDEAPTWPQVRSFAQSKWPSCFSAPLFPLLGIALTAVPIALLGLLARTDAGAVVTGLFWPLAMVGGLFMTILLVGLMFGWPLMWSTVATEGTDAFDALSRSYAYVYQRPLHYILFAIVAAVAGTIGWVIVTLFAELVIHCTIWAASWGASAERITLVAEHGLDSQAGAVGSVLILFWNNVVRTLVAAFAVSFLWSGSTAVYLLLRRQVDAVEMDEVFLDESEERFGLPPLEEDEAGVAGVADESPTQFDTEQPPASPESGTDTA